MSTFGNFITANVDGIVDDFEAFARIAAVSAAKLNARALRDHAKVMLQAVARYMDTAQSEETQRRKSLGGAHDLPFSAIKETSQLHAKHRFEQGFTLPEMLSEYRALRASVISCWTAECQSSQHLTEAMLIPPDSDITVTRLSIQLKVVMGGTSGSALLKIRRIALREYGLSYPYGPNSGGWTDGSGNNSN